MSKKITLHELALNTPGDSPTRHILEEAEKMPKKVITYLNGYMPFQILKPYSPELYSIKSCEWANMPNQTKALSEQKTLTRNLKITLDWRKDGQNQNIDVVMKGVPFPGTKGAYIYGENSTGVPGEYFFSQRLKQKPGIFPINLEEREGEPVKPAFLWESLETTTIQTPEDLLIHLKSETSSINKQQNVVRIPKELWQDFDKMIREARNNPFIRWEKYPKLAEAIKKGFGLKSGEKANARLNHWTSSIAIQQIPQGRWQKRIQGLGLPELAKAEPWNMKAAETAQNSISENKIEFLGVNDLGRKHLESASNVMAQVIGHEVLNCLNQVKFNHISPENIKSHVFTRQWQNKPWPKILASRCILDNDNRTQDDASTPAISALTANKIEVINDTINPNGDRSITERKYDPSFIGAIAPTSRENAEVGRMHILCSGAQIDPDTKEILRPVKTAVCKNGEIQTTTEWMGCEELEELKKNLTRQTNHKIREVGYGRPNTLPELKEGEMTAFLDMDANDHLPIPLLLCPDILKDSPARYPVLEAFLSGASPVCGAETMPQDNETSIKASRTVANNGELLYSPISGTVSHIGKKTPVIIIQGDDGEEYEIPFYRNTANAFEKDRGLKCTVLEGQRIEKGQLIIQPDTPCIIDGRLALGATTLNVSASMVEDERHINKAVVIAGRMTMRYDTTLKTEGISGHPITLNLVQPGTVIKEGDILAIKRVPKVTTDPETERKITITEDTFIRASSDEAGILKAINFVDKDPKKQCTLSINQEALRPVEIKSQIKGMLQKSLQEFHQEMRDWNPNFQASCEEMGIDLRPKFQELNYEIQNDEGQWEKRGLHLSNLVPGQSEFDQLARDIEKPVGKFRADYQENYLIERICRNTHQNVQTLIEAARNQISAHDIPKNVNRVDWIIENEKALKTGSKVACPNGTKGTVKIKKISEMPIVKINGEFRLAESLSTKHAALARGSLGTQQNAGIDKTDQIQKVLWYEEDGFTAAHAELSKESMILQGKSDPSKNNNYIGMEPQGKNKEKATKIAESRTHMAEIGPLASLMKTVVGGQPTREFIRTFTQNEQKTRKIEGKTPELMTG